MTSPSDDREPFVVVTDDGWILRGDAIRAASVPCPRAVAILAHAMMADRRTLDRPRGQGLASVLARRGIEVILVDLRGHGESGPTARQGGTYVYDDFVQHDLPCLVDAARRRHPDVPVTIVGHSLGGHAALAAAGLYPERAPDALVALATNMWVRHTDPVAWRRAAKAATLGAWMAIARIGGRFDPKWLGVRADGEPWPYIAQFGEIFWRDRWASRDGVDYEEAARRAKLPILSIASAGDRLVAEPEVVRRFLSMAEGCDVRYRVVADGEVGERAPGHMGIVTEARCAPIWEEIADFTLGVRRRVDA